MAVEILSIVTTQRLFLLQPEASPFLLYHHPSNPFLPFFPSFLPRSTENQAELTCAFEGDLGQLRGLGGQSCV